MGKYFGTDGFRGRAGVTLTAVHAFRVGRFLGYTFGKKRGDGRAKIVVGKDTRRSSYMFEYALAAGLTSSGADAYLLHVTTTPSVSFVTRTDGFDCGVMISASHNPYCDNGLKLMGAGGEKMERAVLDEIEAYLDGSDEPPFALDRNIGRTVDYALGRNRYVGYLIALSRVSFKGKRVGLDCANGSAFAIARSVFDALGATVKATGVSPDGINVNLACGSTHIENLQRLVLEEGLDVGFAFDGDADRCICVDETGDVVDGDGILYVVAKYLKERGELEGGVVSTVAGNYALTDALSKLQIPCVRTRVGDRYVYEEAVKRGFDLGGEQSGHVIFRKFATCGDGILTAVKMMEAMIESEKPLSALKKGFTPFPSIALNVHAENRFAILNRPAFLTVFREAEEKLASRGRVLVRPSGTEPVVRVLVEGEDEAILSELARKIERAIMIADGEV